MCRVLEALGTLKLLTSSENHGGQIQAVFLSMGEAKVHKGEGILIPARGQEFSFLVFYVSLTLI